MSLPQELACREAVELFSDYLDGVLAVDAKELCEQHLRACEPCMTYLGQLKLTVISLRSLAQNGRLAPEVKEMLLQRFRDFTGR